MPISSISLLRHRAIIPTTTAVPTLTKLLHQLPTLRHLSVAAAAKHPQNPNVSRKSQPPTKKLLKAKQTFKDYSSLAPVLSPHDTPPVSESHAVGTVAAAQANFMRVIVDPPPNFEVECSKVELLCVVRALLKKIKRRVLVGDKVLVGSIQWEVPEDKPDEPRRGVIENVYQRSSEILDPPVANVDHLLVLFSMDQPKPEPFTLTRFLIEAESTGIPLTLALNKSELVHEEEMVSWKTRLHKWGYEPIFCSVESKHGLDSLAFILRDQTSVIVGPSGVGKSSMINALRNNHEAAEGENLIVPVLGSKCLEDQLVGQVSTRSGRGKHTTRNVSLLPLSGGGFLADTPGFNQPSLMKVTTQSLAHSFPEVRKMLSESEHGKCAFNDCLHVGEPGCVVKGDWERYPYYFQLLDEIRVREEFQLRTFGTKKEGDVRYKIGDKGVQLAEPRLQLKKHRRVSRKSMNQSLLDDLDEELDENLLDEEDDPFLTG